MSLAGATRVFAGFDAGNPQHLSWLKRRLARAQRYERRQSRSGGRNPGHPRGRHPAPQLREPMGGDGETLAWQHAAREVLMFAFRIGTGMRQKSIHPQYRRHPITGRIM